MDRNKILSMFDVELDHEARTVQITDIDWSAYEWAFGDRAEVAEEWLVAEEHGLLEYEFDGYAYTVTMSDELKAELTELSKNKNRQLIFSMFDVEEDHYTQTAELVGIDWDGIEWTLGSHAEIADEWLVAAANGLIKYELGSEEYTATLSPELQRALERLAGEQE